MKNKIAIVIAFICPLIYIALSLTGFTGISSPYSEIVYRVITILSLLYVCVGVLKEVIKQKGTGAALPGVLGLGVLLVNEVYTFAYLHILQGKAADITVSNYSRNCGYLFFISAVLLLVVLPKKNGNIIKKVIGTISTLEMLLIFYGVIKSNAAVLYYSAMSLAILSTLCSLCLIIQSFKINNMEYVRNFACSILVLGLLDSLNRLLVIFHFEWEWRDIFLAFYPPIYLFIGLSLLALQKKDKDRKVDNDE